MLEEPPLTVGTEGDTDFMGHFRGFYLSMIRSAPWRPRIARSKGAYENVITCALVLSRGRGCICITLSMRRPTLQIEANNQSRMRVDDDSRVGRMGHRSQIPMPQQFRAALCTCTEPRRSPALGWIAVAGPGVRIPNRRQPMYQCRIQSP